MGVKTFNGEQNLRRYNNIIILGAYECVVETVIIILLTVVCVSISMLCVT